jgi:hypothetical protein
LLNKKSTTTIDDDMITKSEQNVAVMGCTLPPQVTGDILGEILLIVHGIVLLENRLKQVYETLECQLQLLWFGEMNGYGHTLTYVFSHTQLHIHCC